MSSAAAAPDTLTQDSAIGRTPAERQGDTKEQQERLSVPLSRWLPSVFYASIPGDELWQAIYLLVASDNQTLPWHSSSRQSVYCKYLSSTTAETKFLFNNNKFWEELIAHFFLDST
jgi:hypothetical protein